MTTFTQVETFEVEHCCDCDMPLQRFGKKLAGRLLDGAEHNAYPEVAHA